MMSENGITFTPVSDKLHLLMENSPDETKIALAKENLLVIQDEANKAKFNRLGREVKTQLAVVLEIAERLQSSAMSRSASEQVVDALPEEISQILRENEQLKMTVEAREEQLKQQREANEKLLAEKEAEISALRSSARAGHHINNAQSQQSNHPEHQPTGLISADPNQRTATASVNNRSGSKSRTEAWPKRHTVNQRQITEALSVVLIQPNDGLVETADTILTGLRTTLLKYKTSVDFRGLGRTSVRSSKIAVKFVRNAEQEAKMVTELRELPNARVWCYDARETLMIKQIPKWLEDNDVLPDLIASNGLDANGISVIKFINSPQYSNKRMIIKANKETTERIKLNDKLKVGFGYVGYAVLQDDPNRTTCFHCKQTGHRAYRRERTIENGEQTFKRVLICPNRSHAD